MSDDLHTRLHAAITTQRDNASRLLRYVQENGLAEFNPRLVGAHVPGWLVERMATYVIAQCERDLRVLDRHPSRRMLCCGVLHPCPEITDLATVYLETP